MSHPYRLTEQASVVSLLKPAADAGGRTSTYASLKHGHKAFIVCYVNQANAATIALTPLQATDSSGTSSKAITATPIFTNLDADTTPADQFTSQTAAASYTTDAGTKTKLVVFEIDPSECMDINNTTKPFDHIAIQTGASNAANITSAFLVVTPLRYPQTNPPSVNV